MYRYLALLLVLASGNLVAENERLEHLLVSVPIHKKAAETVFPVTVLSGADLRRAAATTIGETLGRQPGVANASFGPAVGRPVIRGQQGPRTITLMNGTSSADVSSFSPDHSVAVEGLLADSIEVLRGPATLLYGGGAIGGVVNVMDNRIPRYALDGVEGAAEYRYDESPGLHSGVFKLEAGNGRSSWHLSGTTRDFDDLDIPSAAIDVTALEEQESLLEEVADEEHQDIDNSHGFIANTDGDADQLTGGFSHHLGEQGFAGLSVSRLKTGYGIPPGAHGHEDEHEEGPDEDHHDDEHEDHHDEEHGEDVRIELEQTRYDALLHWHEAAAGVEVLRAFLSYTDYRHRELEGAEVGTRFDRDTWESRLELVHDSWNGLHGVFGLQWQEDKFSALGEEAYIPETDSTDIGLFLVEEFHRGDWTYELGARLGQVERDPDVRNVGKEDFFTASFAGSLLWHVAPDWRLGLSLSRSARAPSTEELYSNINVESPAELVVHAATGVIEIGDPDLDEELSYNLDLSFNWAAERHWAELSLFYNSFQDYIFLFNTGATSVDDPIYRYRQDEAKFAGFELDSEFFLFQLGAGDVSIGAGGDYIRAEFDEHGDVPRLPPLRMFAELQWQDETSSVWLRARHVADQDKPGDFETETAGFTRWDAGFDHRWRLDPMKELSVFLKWKNIGNEEIRLSTSFLRNFAPEAGESIELGVRYSF